MNLLLLANSLLMSAGATCLAVALGLPVAIAMHVLQGHWRRTLGGLSLLVLALPGFFVAGMWMDWVGFAGAWRLGDGLWTERILPLACSAGVLGLLLWPIAALMLAGAWDGVDARLIEATPELEGRAVLRHVLWPMARGVLPQPVLIIAVLSLANFTVPSLFQARVWPAEVWMEFSTRFEAGAALRKSWLLAIIVFGMVALVLRKQIPWPASGTTPARILSVRLGPALRRTSLVLAGIVLLISLGLPVGAAAANERTWNELVPAFEAAWPAMGRSFVYAAGTATLACILGALWADRGWPVLGVIPFVLPGLFVGIVVAGLATQGIFSSLRTSSAIVLLALGMRYGFVGWYAAHRAWRASDARLHDLARLAGAGRWAQWRHVVWPSAGGTVCGAWSVIYLMCLWDVETLILIVPPGGDSLALMIFNLLHYGHNAQVTALCVLLGILAVAPLAVAAGLRRVRVATVLGLVGLVGFSGATGCSPSGTPNAAKLDSTLFARVEVIGSRGTGPGFFVKPRSVAVDKSDHLYVVDMTGRVQKFTPGGEWQLLWQLPETDKGKGKGMDTGPDGGVLVVEPHYHRINLFTAEGALAGQWGIHGTNAGQLWFPRSIALHGDECFVSEYGVVERVQRFRVRDGAFLGTFGREGTAPAELNRPEGLGVDRAGRVYVADSCNHRIQVFEPDGRFVRAHGTSGQGPGEFSYPYDVRIDTFGNQYVCEFGNSRVQILDSEDRPLEILGGPGTAPDQMHNPWSLCLDSKGNLYVADSQNHRVLKFLRRNPLG